MIDRRLFRKHELRKIGRTSNKNNGGKLSNHIFKRGIGKINGFLYGKLSDDIVQLIFINSLQKRNLL